MTSLPPPDLRSRVLDAVAKEPVPTRSAGARRRAIQIAIGFGLTLAFFTHAGFRLHTRPPGYVAALALCWVPIAIVATWAGVASGRSMLGRPLAWRVAVIALTPAAMMASWFAVALVWPVMFHDHSTLQRIGICNGATLIFALGPFLAFLVVRRQSDPVSPRLTGAAIGTAAAAWAAVALHMICGYTSLEHMLFGHVLPVSILAVAGALLASRTVAVRAKTG
jgi:hypothetical protein